MGLILDSSIIIAAERRGQTVRQILEQIQAKHGEVAVGLSVVIGDKETIPLISESAPENTLDE